MEPEKLFIGKLLTLTFSSSSCDTLIHLYTFETLRWIRGCPCPFVFALCDRRPFSDRDSRTAARLFSCLILPLSRGYLQMLQRRSGCGL